MKRSILITLILALLFTLQPVSAFACEGGCDQPRPTSTPSVADEAVDEHYYQLTATNGVYVIEKDGVSFYRNDVQIRHWDCKTSENDYLFKDLYGRIFAQIGNRIYHFSNSNLVIDASNVICHYYKDGYFYAFYMVGSDLYFWSPERSCFLAMDVDEAVINHSYGFYRQGEKIYALNTTFYRIANATDEYLESYPVPAILLGTGTILDYSSQLTRGASQQSWDQVEELFDKYYGLNRYVWG